MADKIKIVGPGKLDKEGWKKIGKSFLITVGGAAIGEILNLLGAIDYGSFQSIAATFLPFVSNFLYKLLGSYESKK